MSETTYLPEHDEERQANGGGEANLDAGEHDDYEGREPDQEVQLVDLQLPSHAHQQGGHHCRGEVNVSVELCEGHVQNSCRVFTE